MRPVVIIDTTDAKFAETLGKAIGQWGLSHHRQSEKAAEDQLEQDGDVMLFDIRELAGEAFSLLNAMKQSYPDIEVVLINKPDNIGGSIAGMKAGAVDEIIVPFDTDSLKKKITEACKRRKKARTKKNKKSLLARFSDAMAAAAFAQAGSYDDAIDFLDNQSSNKNAGNSPKKTGGNH